jgi:glutaredoxin 3
MRNFARQGLAAGIAIAAAWVLGCRDPASQLAGAASQAATQLETIRAALPKPPAAADPADPEPADAPARTVYYRYLEPGGSMRFVSRIEDVPEAARATAKPIRIETAIAAQPARHGGWAEVKKSARPAPPAAIEPSGAPKPQAAAGSEHEVVVYTTSWCPWCKRTLRWLDAKRVTYVNKDIEANPAWRDELVEKTGRASIPVVEIDGHRISGYDESAMARLL